MRGRDGDADRPRRIEPRQGERPGAEAARARGMRPLPGGDGAPRGRPVQLGRVLGDLLQRSGLGTRVTQAQAVRDWATVVGPGIARVTEALWVNGAGELVVRVTTAAWRSELSLLAPELLSRLNAVEGRAPLTGIRFLHGAPRDTR